MKIISFLGYRRLLKSTKKGFTLIELLVVVAIVGILATVIISSLGNARDKSRNAKVLQIVRQMHTALEMYYLDNGEYPPNSTLHTGSFVCGNDDSSIPESFGSFGAVIDQDLRDSLEEYYPALQNAPECVNISYYSTTVANTSLLNWCGTDYYQARQGYIIGYGLSSQSSDYEEFFAPSNNLYWYCTTHNLNL